MTHNLFKKLIELASKPLSTEADIRARDDSYNDKQTRLRNAEDISEKPRDTSRPDYASTETKNPQ